MSVAHFNDTAQIDLNDVIRDRNASHKDLTQRYRWIVGVSTQVKCYKANAFRY
jgi:hypothetical protein